MREREFVVHLRLLGEGPEECQLYRAVGGVAHRHVATEAFGPVDDLHDVHRWLWREIRTDIRAHPTE